jgi:hypothetical protein
MFGVNSHVASSAKAWIASRGTQSRAIPLSAMEHKGIRYTVTQTANPRVWRWMVQFDGCTKIGTSPSRIIAIQHAIRAIDSAVGAKSSV